MTSTVAQHRKMQMSGLISALHRLPAILLAAALALLGDQATAGMLGMTRAVSDFNFDGNRLIYDISLNGSRLALSADNTVRLTAYDSPDAPLSRPIVRLRGDRRGGELLGGQFNLFGALTPAAEEDVPTLLTASVEAMQTGGTTAGLDFMLGGASATGSRAQQFRNVGIFTSVAGIPDEEYWAQADTMGSVLSLMQGPGLDNPLAPADANPAPIPGPVWLLLAGLLPLIGLRRAHAPRPARLGRSGV